MNLSIFRTSIAGFLASLLPLMFLALATQPSHAQINTNGWNLIFSDDFSVSNVVWRFQLTETGGYAPGIAASQGQIAGGILKLKAGGQHDQLSSHGWLNLTLPTNYAIEYRFRRPNRIGEFNQRVLAGTPFPNGVGEPLPWRPKDRPLGARDSNPAYGGNPGGLYLNGIEVCLVSNAACSATAPFNDNISTNTWYLARVEGTANSIQVWVDSVVQTSFLGSHVTNGFLAFVTSHFGAEVEIDDVKIYSRAAEWSQLGIIADSVAHYSTTQGASNWFYGYYGLSGYGNLIVMTNISDATWFLGANCWYRTPGYWTTVSQIGGHPNSRVANGRTREDNDAVRRWISPVAGPVLITGQHGDLNTAGFGGARVHIVANGRLVLNQFIADGAGPAAYSVLTSLPLGAVVDFIILSDTGGSGGDNTLLTAQISAAVYTPPACTGPQITAQPVNKTACEGQPAALNAQASGTGPLVFQWLKNGDPVVGATSSNLVLANVTFADAGTYTITVSNDCGLVTSTHAVLTVMPHGPAITTQPVAPPNACPGSTITLSVAAHAHNNGALSYQWRKDGNALPAETNASLVINPATFASAGQYDCEVTEANCGATTSSSTTVSVQDLPPIVTLNGPPSLVIECSPGSYAEPGATALDGCDGPLAVTIGGDVVSVMSPGTYFVTYRATDSSGQITMATRTVIVQDTTPPAFTTAPGNLTVACGDANKQTLINQWLASAAATDACGPVTITHTPVAPGACDGSVSVTWTATDSHGLTASTSATLNIVPDRVLTGVQFPANNLHLVVPANVTTQVVLLAVNHGSCPTVFQSASVANAGGGLVATLAPAGLPATVCPADFRTLTLNLDTTAAVPGTYPLLVTLNGPDGGQVVANVEVVVSGLALSDLTPNRPTGGLYVTPASSPIRPLAGEAFTVALKMFNIGATDAGAFSVRFFEGPTLLGVTNVAGLAVNANVTIPLAVPAGRPDGFYLLRAEIVPPAVGEISVANNEASSVLQVGGFPPGAVALVVNTTPIPACNNTNSVLINGMAEYRFVSDNAALTYPVKGGLVTFSNRVTGAVHPGGHTLVDGSFSASVPLGFAGAYTVAAYVTDATLTGVDDANFVMPPLNCPPVGGVTNSPGAINPQYSYSDRNLFICHDDIVVLQSDCTTYAGPLVASGQPICVGVNVHYYEVNARTTGPQPVFFTALQHSNGVVVPHFIGSSVVSFNGGGAALVTVPWTPPVPGTYVIQVRLNPTVEQTPADDLATKTLHVGPPGPTRIQLTAQGWNLCSATSQGIQGHAVYTTPPVDNTIPNDAIPVICGDVIVTGYNQLGQLVGTRMTTTDLAGNYSFNPEIAMPHGSNVFVVVVTDGVLSGTNVIPFYCAPPEPNRPGSDTPPAATADVFVYSEDIAFLGSNCVNGLSRYPLPGESISLAGNIRHYNSLNGPPPAGLPVDVTVLVPAGDNFVTLPVGTVTINNWLADNPICLPWTPTVTGPQIVQVTTRPQAIGLNQFTGNDAATRIIFVGDVRCWLEALPAQQTIQPGQSANIAATATTLAGLSPLLNLSVIFESGDTLPPGMTIGALPPSVRAPGNAAVTVATTIATPPGTYRFILTAAGDGCHALAQFAVIVQDALPPVITLNGAASMTVECHGTFTDPGATAQDNVDGNLTAGIQVAGTVNTTMPGTYTLTYSVTDAAGNTATATRTVIVRDTTPPSIACPPTLALTANVNCQATVPDLRALATVNDLCSGVAGVTVTQTPAPGSLVGLGQHTVTLTATDAAGNSASCTTTITVTDQTPPVLTCPDAIQASAGTGCLAAVPNFVALATATDCNGPVTITQNPAAGQSVGLGAHTVTLTATDAAGNSATCATTFTVVNSAPSIASVTGPVGPLALGTVATVTVNFTDADGNQGHMLVVTWDDGTSTTQAASPGAVTLSRTYAAAGVYTVRATVTDACGATTTSTFEFVVIYDPNGGFVTGGGHIDSPAGALISNPSLSGRANFGFVSKYQKNSNVPTGQTQFQLHFASFNFHSTSYEWLVVAGAKAQYKGRGTVNGTGDYNFLLTATDGQINGGGGVDKFRIKITDRATNALVYDNVLGGSDDLDAANPQAVTVGNIVIHKTR